MNLLLGNPGRSEAAGGDVLLDATGGVVRLRDVVTSHQLDLGVVQGRALTAIYFPRRTLW